MNEDVLFETRGAALWITLNRPQALNALNHPMAVSIHRAIIAAMADPAVAHIVIAGAGDRAFCAGGDVALLGREGRQNRALWESFFHDEYRMNQAIARCGKPWVALIDGITMGGGVGLSIHGPYRVATERTVFAMPETGIGLIPDVGGTHALAGLPGEIGGWLALTGARLKAADLRYCGIATHYVPSAHLATLGNLLGTSHEAVGDILATFDEDPGEASLAAYRDAIDYHFGHDTVEDIVASLERGDEWAQQQAAIIRRMSPTSCKLSLTGLLLARGGDIETALINEYRMVCEIRNGHDFFEGIRAQLIDKDRNPQWQPATLEAVSENDVARHLEVPETGDLSFE
jgi:enoyl-CoA hydratase